MGGTASSKPTRFVSPLLLLTAFCLSHPLFSAEILEDTIKVYRLPELVVTATREERELRDLSATVSVVKKADIEASTANSCTDVLSSLPGVFVHKTGAFGRADVELRGIGSYARRVGVFVDGRPVKMGLFGCAVTHSLPVDNVERIEVVRGPLSVLYGSDALGGVVNIITRRPTRERELDYTLSYGSFQSYQHRIRGGAQLGRFGFYATADRRSSSGHLFNSAYDGEDYTARFGVAIWREIEATVRAKYFRGFKEEPEPAPPETWNDYERSAVDVTVDGKWGRIGSTVMLYRDYGHHLLSDGWHSKDFTNGLTTTLNGAAWKGNRVSGGVEYRMQGGEVLSEVDARWEKRECGVYVHDEQSLWDVFTLVGGLRYNWDEASGDIICPQLGVVWRVAEQVTLRSSLNKGFRTPQISELYIFPSSNEGLQPEVVYNYEIGLNYTMNSQFSVDGTAYRITGENLIQLESNPSPPPGMRFENTGEFEFQGAELSVKGRLGERLRAEMSYTYLDTGRYTKGRPGDKIDFKCAYEGGDYSLVVNGQYIADYFADNEREERIADFFVLSGMLTYQILSGIQVFCGLENVLDRNYEIYVDIPGAGEGRYLMPPRTVTVGLRFEA